MDEIKKSHTSVTSKLKYLMWVVFTLILLMLLILSSCNDDEGTETQIGLTGNSQSFSIFDSGNTGVTGTVTFEEREDNSTLITIQLSGTTQGESHPNHIHENSVVQSGPISISLSNVDGTSGTGVTEVSTDDDGSIVTYSDLIVFDGHIKIHNSQSDLGIILANGDIGENELSGESESFSLEGEGVEGDFKIQKRVSGESLATITLFNAVGNSDYPAHVHGNSLAEEGGIEISLSPVSVLSGTSETHIDIRDDGTAITYEELIDFDGHVKIHASSSDLETVVAGGDIGVNTLTGESDIHDLSSTGNSGITGTITFKKRRNETTLVTIELDETTQGNHPSHIHENSNLEGGSIIISLNNVINGVGHTNIENDNQNNPITYQQLLEINGHAKVHQSDGDFSVVSAGDIGGNMLTGESEEYEIGQRGNTGVNGVAIFEERRNGSALVSLNLTGTTNGGNHPAHIHINSVVEGGGIVINFNDVDGTSGISKTNISEMNDGTSISYEELINYDGHMKIHQSASNFGVIAEGDMGGNSLTGESREYPLMELGDSGITGTVTFEERKSGFTLISVQLGGTSAGDSHPAHIHVNSVAEGGLIIISFNNVDGSSGLSVNQIEKKDNGDEVTFDDLIIFDGHVRIHVSDVNFAGVATGDIGSNVN